MSCEKCRELLWEYLAQELIKEDADFVAAHLAQCPSCKEEANQLQNIMESLKNLPEEELPEGYHNELMEKLSQETKVVPLPVRKKPQYKWKKFSLVAAAALLVVAVGGAQELLNLRGNRTEMMQDMARGSTKDIGNDFAKDAGVSQEDEEQMDIVSIQEKVPEQKNQKSIPQKSALQEEQKVSVVESSPEMMSRSAEMPVPNSIQDEELPQLSEDKSLGITYALTNDTVLEAQQEVILTVENKEGLLDNISDLAIFLGGYEVEQLETDTIKISVPFSKAEEFMDGLKELGETRKIEVTSEKTDDIVFEVTLETK